LDPAARLLFREEDDPLLNYLDEDGELVQPQYFVPVVPNILLNGCEGLGTFFSSFFFVLSIPSFTYVLTASCDVPQARAGARKYRRTIRYRSSRT
jgi:DNA topoisomerase-2